MAPRWLSVTGSPSYSKISHSLCFYVHRKSGQQILIKDEWGESFKNSCKCFKLWGKGKEEIRERIIKEKEKMCYGRQLTPVNRRRTEEK